MIGLIQNELIKIFQRKASWIYMIFIVLALLIGGVIYQKVNGEPDPNWQEQTQIEIEQLQQSLASSPEEDQEWIQSQIDQKQTFLDENINPMEKTNWHYMNDIVIGVSALVTLFAVIVASGNVAAEFSDGTIKQLLIRPHRRWSILLSKYISTLIYSLILVGVLLLFGYLIGLILFGTGDYHAKFFEYSFEGEKLAVIGTQFMLKLVYYLPSLLMITTISFMLSTLFKSQAIAVGIGIFVLFFSSTLGGIIITLAEKYTWAKFLIFPHLDLTVFALQDKILENITLPISLGILAVYYLIFMAITFAFFQKRDISI
jgi:ABC-2 type transport system permease protein